MIRRNYATYTEINYGTNIHGMGIYVDSSDKEKSWLDIEVATETEYIEYCKWLISRRYLKELKEAKILWNYFNTKGLR